MSQAKGNPATEKNKIERKDKMLLLPDFIKNGGDNDF